MPIGNGSARIRGMPASRAQQTSPEAPHRLAESFTRVHVVQRLLAFGGVNRRTMFTGKSTVKNTATMTSQSR